MARRRRCGWVLRVALLTVGACGAPVTITLSPSKDNTIYEGSTGALSNGAGTHLFAGRNSQESESRRRSLVAFDVAGGIPPGSTIQSVTLTMTATRNSSGVTDVSLHAATRDWGEGTSDAGEPGGQGAAASTGDATWIHAFFDTDAWSAAGGDFDPVESARVTLTDVGAVTWGTTESLVADLQRFVDAPGDNFGWVVIGDESVGGTAVRFESRESATATEWPVLTVTYSPPAAAK